MMLMISFRPEYEEKEATVSVDDGQVIGQTMQVLKEAGIFPKEAKIVRSMRTKERIPTESTYRESRIYNGDILIFPYEI